ncbi:MAG: polymer-forming cytoskeletal protein [Patescibacteria group bacterium]|nr:polymer-forming cytoskeletal protein [Patescibacteria group bacterium]
MKMKFLVAALIVSGGLFFTADAQAFSVKAEQSVYISADQTIEGNFYVAGQNITVDGAVNGDILCAGQNIIINGPVSGDVLCVGQAININGEVGGNVRSAGNLINITNKISRNVMAFGASVIFGSKSEIGGDVLAAAASVDARGKIGGEIVGGGASVVIDGPVGKNVSLDLSCNSAKKDQPCGNLAIGKNAVIAGALSYRADQNVKFTNDGTVTGGVVRLEPKVKNVEHKTNKNGAGALAGIWVFTRIIALFGALILAAILVAIFGRRLNGISEKMSAHVGAAFGWGAVLLIVVPVICLFAAITIIGLPVAGVLGLIWLTAMILAKVIGAMAIGEKLMSRFNRTGKSLYGPALLGVLICYLLFIIPVLGCLLSLAVLLWSLGGLWMYFKETLGAK